MAPLASPAKKSASLCVPVVGETPSHFVRKYIDRISSATNGLNSRATGAIALSVPAGIDLSFAGFPSAANAS